MLSRLSVEMIICLLEEKWEKEETNRLCRKSRHTLDLRLKPEKERIPIILPGSKGLIYMRVFIPRIINLLLEEEVITLAILVCMEDQEDHHLAHTPIPMRPMRNMCPILTTMETPGLLMITFGLLIHTIIIRCHPCLTKANRRPCLTKANRVTMVDQMAIIVIHRIFLDVPGLLLDIILMDMEVRIPVLHLPWDTTVALLHHRTIIPIKLLTQTLFLRLGVRDQTCLIRRTDLEKSEQSRVFMMEVKISLFPCHIPSEEQIAVLATVLRQLARLQISLWLSHQTSARELHLERQTIYLPCLALQIFLMKASGQLFEDQILEIRQHQV